MSGPVARAFLVVRLAPASGDDDAPSVAPIRACVSATYGADGGDGTDEVSITGVTWLAELKDGAVTERERARAGGHRRHGVRRHAPTTRLSIETTT